MKNKLLKIAFCCVGILFIANKQLVAQESQQSAITTNVGKKIELNKGLDDIKKPFDDKLMYAKNSLTNNQKKAWDYLYNLLINYKYNENDVKIQNPSYPDTSNFVYNVDFSKSNIKMNATDFMVGFRALIASDPRLIMVENTSIFTSGEEGNGIVDIDQSGNVKNIHVPINKMIAKGDAYNEQLLNIEKNTSLILSNVKSWMNQRQIAEILQREYVKMTHYVNDGESYNDPWDTGSMVGPLGKHNVAVCEGFSRGLNYLLLRAGITNLWTTGFSNYYTGNHAWNLINIYDKWYMMDSTWNFTFKGNDDQYVMKRRYDENNWFKSIPSIVAKTPSALWNYLPSKKLYKSYTQNTNKVNIKLNGKQVRTANKLFNVNQNLGNYKEINIKNIKFNIDNFENIKISGVRSNNGFKINSVNSWQEKNGTFVVDIKTQRVPLLNVTIKYGKWTKNVINKNIELNKYVNTGRNVLHVLKSNIKDNYVNIHRHRVLKIFGIKIQKQFKISKILSRVNNKGDRYYTVLVSKIVARHHRK